MVTTRIPVNRKQQKEITPEAVRLWKLCLEIEDARATERWEDDRRPGRRREYLNAKMALANALGIDWCGDVSPLDPSLRGPRPEMPGYMAHLASGRTWKRALRLRQALIEAEAAADREATAAK